MSDSQAFSIDKVKSIKITDFNYDLPEQKIPRHPLSQRDSCKLLLSRPDGIISHRIFKELPSLLPPSSMLVCNDTKVINARLTFYKRTGARIEIFLLEPVSPPDYILSFQTKSVCVWKCLVGNLKKWKEDELEMWLKIEEKDILLKARKIENSRENGMEIEFSWNHDITFASLIEAAGKIPIPPYLNRDTEESDASDYQTVYADVKGSVAAPTAGLHFTPEVFSDLDAHNIPVRKLTLHVGAGTFQPVKSETIGEHPMHTETFSISKEFLKILISQKIKGNPVTAVGTTSVRTLESLPYLGILAERGEPLFLGQWTAYQEEFSNLDTVDSLKKLLVYMEENNLENLTATTAIMIAPGFKWRITDIMVTNFHQPQSTLLLLVSSFLDRNGDNDQWRKIYAEALLGDYRFLSYGDACLLFPRLSSI